VRALLVVALRNAHRYDRQAIYSGSRSNRKRGSSIGKRLSIFLKWAQEATGSGAVPALMIQTEADLDSLLTEYIQHLYDSGGSKSAAKAAKAGLCLYFPYLRSLLPTADQAIRGWSKAVPVVSYPPLTWELASSLAVHLSRRPEHAQMAIGVVLAFDCLLRIGELLNLKREDIAFDDDPRLGSHRGAAKAGARDGHNLLE
jgi:integrase